MKHKVTMPVELLIAFLAKHYITINLGSDYKGVMVPQTLEPTDTKAPSFTALDSQTGVTIWGYKVGE